MPDLIEPIRNRIAYYKTQPADQDDIVGSPSRSEWRFLYLPPSFCHDPYLTLEAWHKRDFDPNKLEARKDSAYSLSLPTNMEGKPYRRKKVVECIHVIIESPKTYTLTCCGLKYDGRWFTGLALCDWRDEYDPKVGQDIAKKRARRLAEWNGNDITTLTPNDPRVGRWVKKAVAHFQYECRYGYSKKFGGDHELY